MTKGKKDKRRAPSNSASSVSPTSSPLSQPPFVWPDDCVYLSRLVVSEHLVKKFGAPLTKYLDADTFQTRSSSQTQNKPPTLLGTSVKLRTIMNPKHPAYKQNGMFAVKKIPPHTHICDYVGIVREGDEPESMTSDYALTFDDHGYEPAPASSHTTSSEGEQFQLLRLCIDAASYGNEGRMVNDYRGVAAHANAVFANRQVPSSQPSSGSRVCPFKLALYSSHEAIDKNSEILVSYGKGFWNNRTDQA